MEAIQQITKSTPDVDVRTMRRLDIGDVVHQGDIYVHRVADDHPRGGEIGTRKVAVGEGEGSNHIVEGSVRVHRGTDFPPSIDPAWARTNPDCLGPLVEALGDCFFTHPRHADHNLLVGPATYQVTYQRDESTQSRVAD